MRRDYYMYGDEKIYSGSIMKIEGKLHDVDGNCVGCVGNQLATFLYEEDDDPIEWTNGELIPTSNRKVYFDIDGEIRYVNTYYYSHSQFNLGVNYLVTKNGKPQPDPRGQSDVDVATMALVGAMGVSSIFVGAPLWWGAELVAYFKYRKKKLYPNIKKWRNKK